MGFSRQEYWGWVAIPFSRVSSPPRDQTWVSCIVGRFFTSEPFLENSRDRGSWQVAKSQIRLSNQHTQRLFLSRGSIALGPCLPYPENGRGKRTRGREPTLLKDPEEAEMPLARTWSHDHTQMQGRLGNVLQLCTWLQSSFFFFQFKLSSFLRYFFLIEG